MTKEFLVQLDYHAHMHQFYQKFCDLPGFALLESSDYLRGRYDIISAYPYDRVLINEDTPDKLKSLDNLAQLLKVQPKINDLPFQGGAIGYISYDFGAQLYGLYSKLQPSLRDMPLLDFAFYDWAIIVDHYLKKTVLFAANRHPSTAEIIKKILAIWDSSSAIERQFLLKKDFLSLMSKERYQYSFNEIQHALRQGRTYQVNFTQPFHAEYEGDPWLMYQKISAINPIPYSAFLRLQHADILSFSPERFLLHDQGRLLTSPIKGTIRRSHNAVDDERLKQELLASEKNRAENVMIVDLLRNDLGKVAIPGSVTVLNLCGLQSFNGIHHLVSDIEAQCKTDKAVDLFMSCFPGGSITGAPKLESMRIIAEQELFARGVYCGSIGYFSLHGRFDSNIAIRTITAKNRLLHLAAGGGIVIDSNCEDEYHECYIKISAIINGIK